MGTSVSRVEPITAQVWRVDLSDRRSVVIKGVPRQSVSGWKPGAPWSELVALDALQNDGVQRDGAPIPRLLAADVRNGWLATEFYPGVPFGETADRSGAFVTLVQQLTVLEQAMEQHRAVLRPFVTTGSDARTSMAGIRNMLQEEAKAAWDELVAEADLEAPGALGPLDVQHNNVLWSLDGTEVVIVDLAVFGVDFTERRLVAYGQCGPPAIDSLLDEEAFSYYGHRFGDGALKRLLCFDFLFWGIVLARLAVAIHRPHEEVAQELARVWPHPHRLVVPVMNMWSRPRIADDRVECIRQGLGLRFPGQNDDS